MAHLEHLSHCQEQEGSGQAYQEQTGQALKLAQSFPITRNLNA